MFVESRIVFFVRQSVVLIRTTLNHCNESCTKCVHYPWKGLAKFSWCFLACFLNSASGDAWHYADVWHSTNHLLKIRY